jgi:hypothetical protein
MPRADSLPYQFLLKASVPTLESFELSRLNHAANLKKQIADLIEQYLDESTAALLARAMIMRSLRLRPNGADRKRQLPAPRSITSTRAISATRPISSTRSIISARAATRSKISRECEIPQMVQTSLFAKCHAR